MSMMCQCPPNFALLDTKIDEILIGGDRGFHAPTPDAWLRERVVTVSGDLIDEVNERYFVNLTNATNAAIVDSQGVGTITDDDTATASVNDVTVIEGGPAPVP